MLLGLLASLLGAFLLIGTRSYERSKRPNDVRGQEDALGPKTLHGSNVYTILYHYQTYITVSPITVPEKVRLDFIRDCMMTYMGMVDLGFRRVVMPVRSGNIHVD